MSDNDAVPEYYLLDPKATGDNLTAAKEFTTHKWQEVLGAIARDRYIVQRKAALRFLMIPLIFFGLHALLTHLHVRQGVVSLMMVLVIIPLYFFRELMRDVAYRSTAAGMVDLFQLKTFDNKDLLKELTANEFKKLLFEHFCLTGKKKQRKAAVDKLLTTNTGAKKPLMWLSVLFLAIVLVTVSGPFFGLIFALAFACTILTTVRYFRAATPPLKRLGDITLQLGDNPEDESIPTGKKAKKADTKKTTKSDTASAADDETHGPSDKELQQMVTAYHDGTGTPLDNQFLDAFFGNKVPTAKEFKRLMAQTPDDKSDTASAADDTGTTALPPLPKRPKKAAAAPQTGPTGTPAHGTPVVPSALPADGNDGTMHYTLPGLDALFNKWLALGDDGLTPEENKAIESYKPAR